MHVLWAKEFGDIQAILREREDLRQRAAVILSHNMPGKVTEGEGRLSRFRTVMADLIDGRISLPEAYQATALQIPRGGSRYAGDNRVFASGWEERLVRTQFSRLYNQSVLENLLAAGIHECFVPHSSQEDASSRCSLVLAGRQHKVDVLLRDVVESYTHGRWSKEAKIPDHPHCTHAVTPLQA